MCDVYVELILFFYFLINERSDEFISNDQQNKNMDSLTASDGHWFPVPLLHSDKTPFYTLNVGCLDLERVIKRTVENIGHLQYKSG